MTNPKITVLLCTARGDHGYANHPEWDTLGKVIDDLETQTFKDFELVIVDGVSRSREVKSDHFPIQHVSPKKTIWTRQKRVAICAYRNTGLLYARGEFVVNLDDCCSLPPHYLQNFWLAWKYKQVCLSPIWREQGDQRQAGPVMAPGMVFGFGSYPLETAIYLNGYNEAFDGSQGLEDGEWSTRLYNVGVKMALVPFKGFWIHKQTDLSPEAINLDQRVVKCCNQAWYASQAARQLLRANLRRDWPVEWLSKLIGPCHMLEGEAGICGYHRRLSGTTTTCAYISNGFADRLMQEAAELLFDPPLFYLFEDRKKIHGK